jgi:Protein of unknown function (DUF992)
VIAARQETRHERRRIALAGAAFLLALSLIWAQPSVAQQVRAALLTCDVSAGIGLIITSQKQLSCSFVPDNPNIAREDYDGTITKYGLDLGVVGGGLMVWAVFTGTVAGPGFLAGDYFGASGEASLGAGLGANVLVGGSNRTVTLQPISVSGQIGVNVAVGVASLQLGLPRR